MPHIFAVSKNPRKATGPFYSPYHSRERNRPRGLGNPHCIGLVPSQARGPRQHRFVRGLSIHINRSMDSRRLMISTPVLPSANPATPKPRSATDPTGPVPRPSRSRPAGEDGLQAIQPRPVPSRSRCPTSWKTAARSRTASGAGSPGCWRRRRWPPTRGRIRNGLPLIFRWPPVLAWWRDATAGGVLAMLESVPL